MALPARLERLSKLVQANLDALPDRVPEPTASDSDASGGVALDPVGPPSTQPVAGPVQPEPEPTIHKPGTNHRYVLLKHAESSYKPASAPNPASITTPPRPYPPLPAIDLNRGDLGSATQHYSPIVALSKYPYKWCDESHSQDIASAFFDKAKFWAREWDLYYVWDIDDYAKPLILVRETQFQGLLDEINTHLNLRLRITDQQREDALVTRFPDHPRCTPRYLGRSQSREDYDNMVGNAPDHDFRAPGEPESPPLDERSLKAFKQLMEESFEAQKAKNKALRMKKQQERLLKQKTLSDQFKRAQRYLGLRPSPAANAPAASSGQPPAVDPAAPAPFDFDQSVVFVCVDVESYEHAHHKITEVGVATLDTSELASMPPGPDGENWRTLIRARHFRIKEHAHLVNSKFVSGNPEGFDFGKSTFVSLAEAPTRVAACFSPPFGAHHSNGVEDMIEMMSGVNLDEKRNLIFLGHDTLGDVRYLQDLGYNPMEVQNLLEALDTAVMYRVWRRELNAPSLSKILYDFDIAGYGLHNAGNDAVFTVQAMLGICVREASIRGSTELDSMRSNEKSARLAAALEEAEQKAKGEADGWSDDEFDGDGGVPVPLSLSPPKPAPAHASSDMSDGNSRGAFRGRGRGRRGSQAASHNPHDSPNSYGSGSGRGRGRSDQRPPGGLRGYTRGGHVESSRGRGRGRGRGSSNTPSDNNASGSQVHYHW